MKSKLFLSAILCSCLPGLSVNAQSSREATVTGDLPLRRIALLSSGVGYFEHSGTLSAAAEITLPFDAAAVNDALKSLVVNDPASSSPSVRYAGANTLERTLKSLKIDISDAPGIGEILGGQKGAEIEISSPNPIQGRIVGVENRLTGISPSGENNVEPWLSLNTPQGIRAIAIKDIASFRFIDQRISADLNRALDLIMASRDTNARNLIVSLNGGGNRRVSLSYVIPAPVWKVSYRLDLSGQGMPGQAGKDPFLQGWVIVDNDSDADWEGVELSLVTGRPVSFIQNLYPPYRITRPVVPLAIAGIAESKTYESGYGANDSYASAAAPMARSRAPAPSMAMMADIDEIAIEGKSYSELAVGGGVIDTAAGRSAGDQFEFTLKSPVTLERRQSAMLPLVEAAIKAEKTLVFSGSRSQGGGTIHPDISAELTNTSGMKLPAGPITVYDGGTYAGDALIEFFPESEKRLISYGEDLSVSGNMSSSVFRTVSAVNITGGVMTISRRQSYEKEYTLRNASAETKKLIIEHPITPGTELTEPQKADDRTGNLYRFSRNLGARETLSFQVKEETPIYERITLAQLRPEALLSYSSNQEIPANVRAALSRAIELKKKADDADSNQKELENQLTRLTNEQDRIRRNLEAAGNTSVQGQEYLKRLAALDNDIDKQNSSIDASAKEAQQAKKEYSDYLSGLKM